MTRIEQSSPAFSLWLFLKLKSARDGKVRVVAAAGIRYGTGQLAVYDYQQRIIDRVDLATERVMQIQQVRCSVEAPAHGRPAP